MYRIIKSTKDTSDTLDLSVDVYFDNIVQNINATKISPVVDSHGDIDPKAREEYDTFVETALSIIDYYGFECVKVINSKSFPMTSTYRWVAHDSEITSNNVPLFINLRISDHFQNFNDRFQKELTQRNKKYADELKLPRNKKRQRYKPENIVVNKDQYNTYEEALQNIEDRVRSWLKFRNIDLSDYEYIGNW